MPPLRERRPSTGVPNSPSRSSSLSEGMSITTGTSSSESSLLGSMYVMLSKFREMRGEATRRGLDGRLPRGDTGVPRPVAGPACTSGVRSMLLRRPRSPGACFGVLGKTYSEDPPEIVLRERRDDKLTDFTRLLVTSTLDMRDIIDGSGSAGFIAEAGGACMIPDIRFRGGSDTRGTGELLRTTGERQSTARACSRRAFVSDCSHSFRSAVLSARM
mmetsp:Transcript_28745/g.80358  ORF Transcript_28745/g.80358 Transcript_28745/m.80358 type:complete len:216 (-) Transcript_28745:1217-1864(-)